MTEETLVAPAATTSEKYTAVIPETMHETSLSDSEDEGLQAELLLNEIIKMFALTISYFTVFVVRNVSDVNIRYTGWLKKVSC